MHKRILLAALVAAAVVVCPARATVNASNNTFTYVGNGATTIYTVPFKFLQNADLVVTVAGVTKTLGSDFTLSGAGNPTGTITFTTAPANSASIVITRTVDYLQKTSLRTQRTYDASSVEGAIDKVTMQAQQLQNLYTNPPASVLPANVVAKLNNIRFADQFANIQAAITDAGTTGAVLIPSSYVATDTWTNPNGIPIIDLRGGAGKWRGVVSVRDWGAVGDGSTDDSGPVQTAITAANGGTIVFPAGTYKVASTITISVANTKIVGTGGKIFMAHGSATPVGGILFSVTASNVEFDNLWIDSTGSSSTTTINHYAIRYQGSSGTHLTNARIRNCQFTNLPWADNFGAVVSTHALYIQWVDNVTVQNNRFDAPSGAAVFLSADTSADILDNKINNTGWYSIQLNDQVNGFRISGNRITGTTSGVRVWGGSINLMSNSTTGAACGTPGCATIKNGEIDHNYISGVHSYTAAVHIESCSHIRFHHNMLENISLSLGSPFYADGTPPDHIRVYVRPIGANPNPNEGPNDHIYIEDNDLVANGIQNLGIYVDAQDNGSGTLPYSDTVVIARNVLQSKSASHYFQHGIILHGQQGGWKNVVIKDNVLTGFPDASGPVSGMIGTVGLVAAPVLDIQIVGNNVDLVGGVASTTTHVGIAIDAYSQRVQVGGNTVRDFWNGIRTFANASSLWVGPPNVFFGSGSTNYTLGVTFQNRSTITLAAGTGTATVLADQQCTCTDTTANASVKCAVSGTTLTATGTGTDVIAFDCK